MFGIQLAWDRPARTNSGGESTHILRIRISPHAPVETGGLPLRVAIALDVSGSMEGPRLEHARRACEAVAAMLRPQDQLWLAAFSTEVKELLAAEPGGGRGAEEAMAAVAPLVAFGSTRTDLALRWMGRALQPETGTARAGILITDGEATDVHGTVLKDISQLTNLAGRLGETGITLCAVGLGNAEYFNTACLTALADRGRGAFIFAPTPDELAPQLQARLAESQATVVDQMIADVMPLRSGLSFGAACRFRPSFAALEWTGKPGAGRIALGALTAGPPTDILVQVRAQPLQFGQRTGVHDIVEAVVEGGGTTDRATAALEWTNSLMSAQAMNVDVNNDRILWDVNLYAGEVQQTTDLGRTADLLKHIADGAQAAGALDIAARATADLDDLRRKGVRDPNRNTATLADIRRAGGSL